MSSPLSRNIRLGVFTVSGIVFLVVALYFIGAKQNLFGSTFKVSARFHNVNGLMTGNNVRFGGIDVGTVENIEIINDTAIKVTMIIEKDIQRFIKKNALVSIGSDGLMGNKLVNINGGPGSGESVNEGDVLQSIKPIEMDESIRTLNVTNENIQVISKNLRNITDKINSENSFWNLLMDTVISYNIKSTFVNFKLMSSQSVNVMGDLKKITGDVKSGKGTLGTLISDTAFSSGVRQTIVKIKTLGDSVALVTSDISSIINKLKKGEGTAGILLNDTTLLHDLNMGVKNIEKGAGNFNENMEALKHSWPFKKYYRKQKKQKK